MMNRYVLNNEDILDIVKKLIENDADLENAEVMRDRIYFNDKDITLTSEGHIKSEYELEHTVDVINDSLNTLDDDLDFFAKVI